jgi:hypothetical protein
MKCREASSPMSTAFTTSSAFTNMPHGVRSRGSTALSCASAATGRIALRSAGHALVLVGHRDRAGDTGPDERHRRDARGGDPTRCSGCCPPSSAEIAELQMRIIRLAREGSPPPGLRLPQAEL